VFVAPYAVMLLDALRPSGDVLRVTPSFLPRPGSGNTFGTVLGDERFIAWLKTSLLVATSSTAIVVVVAVPAAFFTARFRFPGPDGVPAAGPDHPDVLADLAGGRHLPGVLRAEPGEHLPGHHPHELGVQPGLRDLDPAGFFSSIPRDVEEAANLDGCGRIGTLWHIMLPLIRPGW
jgi:multiple sugar transport system permease protein